VAAGLTVGTAIWIHSGSHIGTLASITAMHNAPGPKTHFFDLPNRQLLDAPYRSNYVNAALPITYTEIWGDWIGAFAWSTFMGQPTGTTLTVLRDQNAIGLLPSFLALCGYGVLLARVIRGRRDLLVVVLVPPIAITGYLLRSYQHLSPDGDLFKASYVLTTAPMWSLAFGVAFAKLGRWRFAQLGLGLVFVVFAIMELRFTMYGLRDGTPPF
jgi:hypothetical protein